MSDHGEPDARAMAEADRLDAQIDRALAGRPDASGRAGIALLATAIRTDPPAHLAARVRARVEQAQAEQMQRVETEREQADVGRAPGEPVGAGGVDRIRAEREAVVRQRRLWWAFRIPAAVLAYLFLSHGVGNLLWGEWVAEGVGDEFSPHAMREGAFAIAAVGVVVAAGALSRRFAPVAALGGVPLAVLLGIGGIAEIGTFTPGAVLHLSQGAVGVVVAVAYWRLWRYSAGSAGEEGV